MISVRHPSFASGSVQCFVAPKSLLLNLPLLCLLISVIPHQLPIKKTKKVFFQHTDSPPIISRRLHHVHGQCRSSVSRTALTSDHDFSRRIVAHIQIFRTNQRPRIQSSHGIPQSENLSGRSRRRRLTYLGIAKLVQAAEKPRSFHSCATSQAKRRNLSIGDLRLSMISSYMEK